MQTILIMGCGNMGGAMLAGWLRGGMNPAQFTVVDPVLDAAPAGVELLRVVPQGRAYAFVLLAIKPQLLPSLAPAINPAITAETTVLSVLAGAELASLAALFPQAKGTVRVMPNLAAAIGKSPVALSGHGQLDTAAITALFAPLGTVAWLDEQQFDVLTALVGSGPAFVYRFIDALASGAVALGLPKDAAQALALAMVEGAGALAGQAGVAPDELARRVASPGGTTEAGLRVLDQDAALARLVAETLAAASQRSAEMAEIARK